MDFFEKKEKDLGVRLNSVQKQAVLHNEGPLLLLASPGSGKTTTTIMRIGYMLEELGVNPAKMLAVTFSKASAEDMTERFERFFPDYPKGAVHFSTIHSIAFEIVRKWMKRTNQEYQMIEGAVNEEEMKAFKSGAMKTTPMQKSFILSKLYRDITDEWATEDIRDQMASFVGYAKNRMVKPDELDEIETELNQAKEVFLAYEDYKERQQPRLMDYDDMLTLANVALEEDADLLAEYQKRFQYVLTDESQDTSLAQHMIVEKLVAKHQNLYVVADDDQTVYEWRGASVGYLLNFEAIYPKAKILFMEQNYRSDARIVEVANTFIKRVKNRYAKNMRTDNSRNEEAITMKTYGSHQKQMEAIVEGIQQKPKLEEVAILFRNNASSVAVAHSLLQAKIPFYMKDTDHSFFKHYVVKDVLNFMRLSYSSKIEHLYLLDELRKRMPVRIPESVYKQLSQLKPDQDIWEFLMKSEDIKFYYKKSLKKIQDNLPKLKKMTPEKAVDCIMNTMEYKKSVMKYAEFIGTNKESLERVMETVMQVAKTADTLPEFSKKLDLLQKEMRKAGFRKDEKVLTLSTFHGSKGLEFDDVYLIDVQTGQVPTKRETRAHKEGKEDALDESARLFYVAMTRARKNLHIAAYTDVKNKDVKASPYYTEVLKQIKPHIKVQPNSILTAAPTKKEPAKKKPVRQVINYTFNIDMPVDHKKYGDGVILNIESGMLTIEFENVGVKKLDQLFCITNQLLKPKEASAAN